MESRTVQAFAKINLSLDITGKRGDGYHFIRSVMQAIRLHDRIRVTAKGRAGLFGGVRIRLTASDPSGQPALDIPAGEDNLAYRAALCLAEHFCPTKGNQIHIHIEKSIPVAAGLAGGSADAAAVFLSLAALWHLNGGLNPLLALGAKLGADIPFCISAIASGNPDLGFSEDPLAAPAALAEGIGEILTPLPTQGGQVHLLKPPIGVPTVRLYQMYDQQADKAEALPGSAFPPGPAIPTGIPSMPMDPKDMFNVFEPLTAAAWPDVARILACLKSAAPDSASKVMMSGSGPTVFLWQPSAVAPPDLAGLDLPPKTLYLRSDCL